MAEPYYFLTPVAAADLHAIEDYISEDSGEARAQLIMDRIHRSLTNLSHWPRSGRIFARSEQGALHTFSVPPWIVLYEAPPDFDGIYVLRVVDGRRDLDTLFESYRS